jgi:hypothetical protein
MSLEQIFYVSQSIAAVAVIASLLYLAAQVRQAERVQRATMQQGRADRGRQFRQPLRRHGGKYRRSLRDVRALLHKEKGTGRRAIPIPKSIRLGGGP